MSRFSANQLHLVRRFFTSLSKRTPDTKDVAWVNERLLVNEFALWNRMEPHDQRHSIEVANRFTQLHPTFTLDELAAGIEVILFLQSLAIFAVGCFAVY